MSARAATIMLAACLLAPCPASAQATTLLESYARVSALLNYMTAHIGELLLACAEKNVLTEEQMEARYQAYRKRNAVLLERAGAWRLEAERRLQAQGDERAAARLAEETSLSAMADASIRAQGEIAKARDIGKFCAARLAAIESGHYDLSGNAEFIKLLGTKP